MSGRWRTISGLSLGALLGILLGLSISNVVGSFLTAAVAIAATVLGTAPLSEKARANINHDQIAAFGIACTLFILAGVYLRTHEALSPSQDAQIAAVKKWMAAGLSPDYATTIVTGISPPAPNPKPDLDHAAADTLKSANDTAKSTNDLLRAALTAVSSMHQGQLSK